MKKDTPTSDKKVIKYILEQQLPEARVEGIGAKAIEDAYAVNAEDHVTQATLEACRCVHLQEHLPHLLNLEVWKAASHPRGWVVANPVHSMHIQSQLEDSVPTWVHEMQPPILYGDEQQRTMALNSEGMSEHFCPLTGYSVIIHNDETLETKKSPKAPSVQPSVSRTKPSSVYSSAESQQTAKSANAVVKQESLAVPDMTRNKETTQIGPSTADKTAEATVPSTSKNSRLDEPAKTSTTQSLSSPKVGGAENESPHKETTAEPGYVEDCDTTKAKKDEVSVTKSDSLPADIKSSPQTITQPRDFGKNKPIQVDIASSYNGTESKAKTGCGSTSQDADMKKSSEQGEPSPDNKMDIDGTATAMEESKTVEMLPPVIPSSVQPTPLPDSVTSKGPDEQGQTSSMSAIPNSEASAPVKSGTYSLPDEKFNQFMHAEERIQMIRRSLSSNRIVPKKKTETKKRPDPKKKRKREDLYRTSGIPGFHVSNMKDLTKEQEMEWVAAMDSSRATVSRWMENLRKCREAYWDERERRLQPTLPPSRCNFYLSNDQIEKSLCCVNCTTYSETRQEGGFKKGRKPRRLFSGDDIMQCLECGFVGCSPRSITYDSKQHILQHLLLTDHKFAMSCGERGRIFCFCCGDFVYHEVFEQEKARIDYTKTIPNLAWKPHQLFRSFNPFHFMKTQENGIVWRGLIATYPQLVPREHIRATEFTSRRQDIFKGELQIKCLANRPRARSFSASQALLDGKCRHRIVFPIGMYNLGNTCYKSAVLQCLVHCMPLQEYFLKENGHHHHACRLYRQWEYGRRKKRKATVKPEDYICLACDMDRLFLSYYGSTIGVDVRGVIEEACCKDPSEVEIDENIERGDPLVISEMLTASWKSGGMNSLASYKQHDSHEFLNSFLELFGKQTKQHWTRVKSAIDMVKNNNGIIDEIGNHEQDIVKRLFEGSLSSVLLCEECGTKRKRSEAFLNVSLSLSEEMAKRESFGGDSPNTNLCVENCLERFVAAEKLGDPVDCPSCSKKTATLKQHTFGKLPRVLCLHLKRFDAARNRKIDDFVSFPATDLNMGRYLSQWSEVSSTPSLLTGNSIEPEIKYDLFGTVNHVGNMSSGHYITNVKVDHKWYTFNDAHVSLAGGNGGHETVVGDARAYILFYLRQN